MNTEIAIVALIVLLAIAVSLLVSALSKPSGSTGEPAEPAKTGKSAEHEKPKKKPAPLGAGKKAGSSPLIVKIPGRNEAKAEEIPDRTNQRPLDEEYAKNNSMWMCPRCETLNSNAEGMCACCGAKR